MNDITTGQLAQDKNNVAVYVGADNIKNDVADQSKDVSDAIIFILSNKFKSDDILSSGNGGSGNLTASLAASLSGSILSGFLNQQFGEYVKSVEVTTTKFALSGQAGKFKYTIGGATKTMQDLGQADVQIVYPFTQNFLIRLERKQSVGEQQTNTTEMINELGLKYIFNF